MYFTNFSQFNKFHSQLIQQAKRVYVETSAVNYFFDNIFNNKNFCPIKTKELEISRGKKWQISCVTLWEIFLTQDKDRRNNLFDFSRYLFFDDLISSPEEIIINYIKSDCPDIEKMYELKSNSLFANEWSKACKNFDYEFEPNKKQLEEFTNHLQTIGKYLTNTYKGYILKPFNRIDDFSSKIDGTNLKSIFKKLVNFYGKSIDDEDKNYIAISLQIVLIILCYGISFDQQIIEKFWNTNTKLEPLERLDFLVNNFPKIFFQGPLSDFVKMLIIQSCEKTGRGLYFDSLHAIYVTYSDLYYSTDKHFLKFKLNNLYNPNAYKILNPQDFY